ncbi:hypothetical protein DDE18_03060 [Nocardioides gansuensis]|uniref:HTH tetR-type domain-containing protein n=1 Tax=Nocardioides gansuensis TaxID=2138300 RepID=A0A2T8FFW5_9ACTN|nr:TetR/AcrR family transcriptional regulator [Nocardioides gansuensis]PVG84594.1 hypothetical protein DDE18_03060 [Nocardioides gansuensis]
MDEDRGSEAEGFDPLVPAPAAATTRRTPQQRRSRQRVARILDAASALVLEGGVERLSTRRIAEVAGVPVASLYQYFGDKEDVLLALVDRDMAEMDAQVLQDLQGLANPSLGELVATAMRSFTKVYARRPAFVEIWMRGRTNPAIRQRGRDHNELIATTLHEYAAAAGLVPAGLSPKVPLLAVEVGDKVFQLAYENDIQGDPELVEEGIRMVTAYLAPYAAPTAV